MCMEGKAQPDDLTGGTFTVTNLGAMGIDTFTPAAQCPGSGDPRSRCISMRAIEEEEGDYAFIHTIALSLTIDHQGCGRCSCGRFLRHCARYRSK